MPRLVAAVAPGTKVDVEILRDGKKQVLTVTLGTLPEEAKDSPTQMQPAEVEETLGLRVEAITPDLARALRLENMKGVIVSQVTADGPAAEAGIRRGDVVREVNRHAVADMDSYSEATAHLAQNAPVLFLLERRGNSLYVAVKPGKEG